MHLEEDLNEKEVVDLALKKISAKWREKILACKITDEHLENNINEEKCILCQKSTDNLSPYVTSFGCFRLIVCSATVGPFSPFSQNNVFLSTVS